MQKVPEWALVFVEGLVLEYLNFGTRYECQKLAKSRTPSGIKKLRLKMAKHGFKIYTVFQTILRDQKGGSWRPTRLGADPARTEAEVDGCLPRGTGPAPMNTRTACK